MESYVEQVLSRRKFIKAIGGGVLGIGFAGCIANKTARTTGPFSFGVVADVQYADYPAVGNRHYRQSEWKLRQCVEDFNSRDLDFVVQLGDFIDGGFANFDKMLDIYQRLKAPKYHVLGNHDFAATREKVLAKLGMERGYYDFVVNGWRFIVLDGNEISLYANSRGSDEYKQAEAMQQRLKEAGSANAASYNGDLSARQRTWLEERLGKATKAGEKVIVFCHFPVHPPNAHNLWGDSELVELFESYDCVAAYMNGHNHAGNYAEEKGIHYITFKGMVESPDRNAYAVVEVWPDHLKITGFGAAAQRFLTIENKK